MSLLCLWIPKDFDKRYEKYRSKFVDEEETPEVSLVEKLETEKENLKSITDEEEYENEVEKWRPMKVIVDAIYKELSPFNKGVQSVKIDLSKLGISENITSSIWPSPRILNTSLVSLTTNS